MMAHIKYYSTCFSGGFYSKHHRKTVTLWDKITKTLINNNNNRLAIAPNLELVVGTFIRQQTIPHIQLLLMGFS